MKYIKLIPALLMLPFCSFAWNGIGHSTGGAIAYYYLKSHNPAVITKVVAILKNHPWYSDQKHWAGKLAGLSGEKKNVMLFMLASTFPDDARNIPALGGGEKPKWHYVDYPLVQEGSGIGGKQPESPNAQEKLAELITNIPSDDATQKAIDVCWLFHLIEDIHQPLHTACMFDENNPDGDRGGNSTYIRFPDKDNGVKLHSYWDGLVKGNMSTIPANAQNLLNNTAYSESKLTELRTNTSIEDWIKQESLPMAETVAYDNDRIIGTSDEPTDVDADYETIAKKKAERRIVLAGIRVAKELTSVLHTN